ncbi:hypothetical protein HID58_065168 [Brassica napus]|uniref:Uncharacterized protein n=1 Tax=Brassica napus TaxID=3708 RepID=A0ABQ7ZC14_BRANA|nr:hypothetical protein HID58_065168 [Brassica napus]
MVHGGLSVLELRRDCGLGFCGGETDRLDQGAIPGGGGSYSSVVVSFLREVEVLICSAAAGSVFSGRGGLQSSAVAVGLVFCSCRLGETGDTSDEIFEEVKPLRRSNRRQERLDEVLSMEDHRRGRRFDVGFEIRRKQGLVRWLRRRFEAEKIRLRRFCDACRSEGVDASTCPATCFLDARSPAGVGRV